LVLLAKLTVLAKCLARKTPLRKAIHGKEIIYTKPRLKSTYDFQFSVLFHVTVCLFCPLALHNIFHTPQPVCADSIVKHQSTNQPCVWPLYMANKTLGNC